MGSVRRLSRAAGRHEGTFTRSTARKAGLSHSSLERAVAREWVDRLARDRYVVAGAPDTWHRRLEAAILGIESGGASHGTAAVLWELPGFSPGEIELLVPVGRGSRNPLATIHRSRTLLATDFTALGRWPLTTPTRTLLDLARVAPTVALLEAFDDAICRGLTTPERIARHAARVLRQAPRDAKALVDQALAAWTVGPLPANRGEMAVVRLLLEAGFPPPERQVEVRARDGRLIARVDLAYVRDKLAIERLSRRWHGSGAAQVRDAARRLELQAAGWRVIEVTSREIAEGGARFLAAVGAHLGRADLAS